MVCNVDFWPTMSLSPSMMEKNSSIIKTTNFYVFHIRVWEDMQFIKENYKSHYELLKNFKEKAKLWKKTQKKIYRD